MEKDFPAISR